MNLIAKSCFCPGLISLLSNLITSFDSGQSDENKKEWVKEYVKGLEHEMYRVPLDLTNFNGDFITMAVTAYEYT